MDGLYRGLTRWFAAGAVLGGLIGCEESRYSTPESTFSVAKNAANDGDYTACCDCFTAEGRDTLAVGMVFIGGILQMGHGEEAKATSERVRAIFKRHGLTKQRMPAITLKAEASDEEKKHELLRVVAPIKDRTAFVVEMIDLLKEVGDQKDSELLTADAHLVDLQIVGDEANGTLVQTRHGRERPSPIRFERFEGEWKISDVPRLLN